MFETAEQRQIRQHAARFAEQIIKPQAESLDAEERFPEEIYQQMGEVGVIWYYHTRTRWRRGAWMQSLTRLLWKSYHVVTRQ